MFDKAIKKHITESKKKFEEDIKRNDLKKS